MLTFRRFQRWYICIQSECKRAGVQKHAPGRYSASAGAWLVPSDQLVFYYVVSTPAAVHQCRVPPCTCPRLSLPTCHAPLATRHVCQQCFDLGNVIRPLSTSSREQVDRAHTVGCLTAICDSRWVGTVAQQNPNYLCLEATRSKVQAGGVWPGLVS